MLGFPGTAGEAMKFYLGTFKNSKFVDAMLKGNQFEVLIFRINDQELTVFNRSLESKPTPAIAFRVVCKTQREIDTLWARLSKGGSAGPCGWITDRYGVTWLIVPKALEDLMRGTKNAGQKDRVWNALMQMTKIDIKALKRAANPVP